MIFHVHDPTIQNMERDRRLASLTLPLSCQNTRKQKFVGLWDNKTTIKNKNNTKNHTKVTT